MIITAASFPMPTRIKRTNNPAEWDQQARFADLQAAQANLSLADLGRTLDNLEPAMRPMAFVKLYNELAEWRFQLAQRTEGQRPNSEVEHFHRPIADDTIRDSFGRGLLSEGSQMDPERGELVGGTDTPASLQSARLGELIEARFASEAPGFEVLQNRVAMPDGSTIAGNTLLRGGAAAREYGMTKPVDGFYCALTGLERDRLILQREAFSLLADLENQRAAGRTDLVNDPDAQLAFTTAEYYLYQGPHYARGGDAMIRTLLVTAHARIFDAPVKLPEDIDVIAYVAGQGTFNAHVSANQSILPPNPAPTIPHQTAAPRPLRRSTGLDRG
ncbi:hypothetical protein [Kribbella solani]|uniref:hypothetical protein n=1 Tax=Kribbella solani TaxID=236067 RepID=UPI0029ADB7AC|nr:hypothetical protein [Kribbella solani]MDX2970768.1 hypothetical protein [Kribbella solani]